MARCDGPNCDADIVWAETPEGRRQPFDREPNPDGNRILVARGPSRAPLAIDVQKLLGPDPPIWGTRHQAAVAGVLYMPHHATCPDAERFR